jgi:chemotaxis protein MotB
MRTAMIVSVVALAASGCVSKGKYDEAVAQTNLTRAELVRKNVTLEQMSADLAHRREEILALTREIDTLSDSRTFGRGRIARLQKRLSELEAAQAAAEARAALYRDLTLRLKRQIDDGDLTIVVRDGRMVLQLPNDVLFDTGRTELKPAGKKALEAVAEIMSGMPSRQFQISGHTDNVPIHNDHFGSNWELSSGRALRVVHFLLEKGLSPSMLSAAGYGEVDPVSASDTPEGRKRNRRTEITLQPNIDELVTIPQ